MSKKAWIDDTHYRVTSDNGRKSYVYEQKNDLWGTRFAREVADHHSDGTTTAYEYNYSIFGPERGRRK